LKQFAILENKTTIPIPLQKSLTAIRKTSTIIPVRKIKFSSRGEPDTHLHPAPDPILLLSKAVSNWLKRCNLNVLPGYPVDEDEEGSSEIISYDDYDDDEGPGLYDIDIDEREDSSIVSEITFHHQSQRIIDNSTTTTLTEDAALSNLDE
jgi:hypothetical protein